jgi:hypothetical protein
MLIACVLLVAFSAGFRILHFPTAHAKRITSMELLIVLGALLADHVRTENVNDDCSEVLSFWLVLRRSLGQTAFVGIVFFAYVFGTKDSSISAIIIILYLVTLFGALLASGWVLPGLLGRIHFHRTFCNRILLLGSVPTIDRYSMWIKAKQEFGIEVIGVITPIQEPFPAAPIPFPILGPLDSLLSVLSEHKPHTVVHIDLTADRQRLEEYQTLCDQHGARFLPLSDFARSFRDGTVLADDLKN